MAESDAYQQFYRRTVRPLAAHLRKLGVANPQDLEELIQETYLQAYRSWDSLNDSEAAVAWVLTIGRRQFGRHLERQRQRTRLVNESTPLTEDTERGRADLARIPTPEDEASARSLCSRIVALVNDIGDERKRRVIELFYLQEAQLPEVSALTGVNTSTLTTWLSRFREQARKVFKEQAKASVRPQGAAVVSIRTRRSTP